MAMFEEPEQQEPQDRPFDPQERAKAKSDEFRMHAELAAVFEAVRKFDARVVPKFDANLARECQRTIGKLEKVRLPDTPAIPPDSWPLAVELLDIPESKKISTNDYHVHRRPGECVILRWLEGEQVDQFYTRLQAHFDAALKHFREDERQSLGWKQEEKTLKYLEALDAIDVKMEEKYIRPLIREHKIFVLSTQAADEMDILHLCDFIMGVPAAEVVGKASAPGDDPTESDRAWYFKLFSLRGMKEGREQMLFFTYLQKTDDTGDWDQEDEA